MNAPHPYGSPSPWGLAISAKFFPVPNHVDPDAVNSGDTIANKLLSPYETGALVAQSARFETLLELCTRLAASDEDCKTLEDAVAVITEMMDEKEIKNAR